EVQRLPRRRSDGHGPGARHRRTIAELHDAAAVRHAVGPAQGSVGVDHAAGRGQDVRGRHPERRRVRVVARTEELVMRAAWMLAAAAFAIAAGQASPYRTVTDHFKLPDGRTMGSVCAIDIDRDGRSVWVF